MDETDNEKPPFPQTVRIGYRNVRVLVKPKELMDACQLNGSFHHGKGEIELCESLAPAYMAEVLLHECIHGCHVHAGMNDDDAGYKAEQWTDVLGKGLAQVIRDNPKLVRWVEWAVRQ